MGVAESLDEFRDLHERAKLATLQPLEMAKYHADRESLARLLLSSQHVALLPGQRPRAALRVAGALQADIHHREGTERTVTVHVSSGGFGAQLERVPEIGTAAEVALRIPGGPPVRAVARMVGVSRHASSSASGSFQFVGLDEEQAERVEKFVFDAILDRYEGL